MRTIIDDATLRTALKNIILFTVVSTGITLAGLASIPQDIQKVAMIDGYSRFIAIADNTVRNFSFCTCTLSRIVFL